MDDLTRLKGIGKVAAKILTDAGLTTFAAVAASYGSRPEGLAASVDWAAVVAEAAGLSTKDTEGGSDANGAPNGTAATSATSESEEQDGQSGARSDEPEKGGQVSGAGSEPAPGAALTITGPKRGRWRAGRHFGPQPVTIPLADLTEAEIAALRADPALTVGEAV